MVKWPAVIIPLLCIQCYVYAQPKQLITVNGPVSADHAGIMLPHEHILVDFIGAKSIRPGRYNRDSVIKKALPKLVELKKAGCHTFVDCTPAYLGRDVRLLKMLSAKTGLNILSNTGYYGASAEKYLPEQAYIETAAQIARRWVAEWTNGIEGTGIRPGFVKLAADKAPLTPTQRKMIEAGAITHLKTGLTIAIHNGNGKAAREELAILTSKGVKPDAFIWVHAQNEEDFSVFREMAKKGVWISFDGLSAKNQDSYLRFLLFMQQNGLLYRTLISHDSGWYHVGEPGGGTYNGYTTLFKTFIPVLKKAGFTKNELKQLLQTNPFEAYAVGVKRTH